MGKFESLGASRSTAAEYAARGRAHGALTLEELAEKWIAAFSAIVRAPGRVDFRSNERDLSAEFKLRNIEPPYQDVQEDRERLIAEISEQLEVLRTSLPHDFGLLQAATLELAPPADVEAPTTLHDTGDDALGASHAKPTALALRRRLSRIDQRDRYLASSRRDH